jgi:hypothetical protein
MVYSAERGAVYGGTQKLLCLPAKEDTHCTEYNLKTVPYASSYIHPFCGNNKYLKRCDKVGAKEGNVGKVLEGVHHVRGDDIDTLFNAQVDNGVYLRLGCVVKETVCNAEERTFMLPCAIAFKSAV